MKTIKINVFSFNELSEAAKKRAHENYVSGEEFFWSQDYINTIEKCLEFLGGELVNYSIDWQNFYHCTFALRGPDEDIYGKDILVYLQEHGATDENETCNVTGFCSDSDFFEPIHDFIKKFDEKKNSSVSLNSLLHECVKSTLKAGIQDYEQQLSLEGFEEHCEANELQFLTNGDTFEIEITE